MTFTSKHEADTAVATLETANVTEEAGEFIYYNEAVKVNSTLFDHTSSGATHYAARLTGTTNERFGLAKSISVMPGDTIRTRVFAKYLDTNSGNWTTVLNNLMTAIANNTAPAGTVIDGGLTGSTGGVTSPLGSLLDKGNETGTAPKAYLNYLVFDRRDTLIDAGFVRVSTAAREYGQDGAHEELFKEITITEAGYVYLYLSNDNVALGGSVIEVFFDDFTVEHVKSSVIQQDDYYAFGLNFNSYQRENAEKNNYLFNDGSERQDELDLNIDLTDFRAYDPTMGRWWQIDPKVDMFTDLTPYNYSFNNPIRYNDPKGDCPTCVGAIINLFTVAKTKYSQMLKPGQESLHRAASGRSGNTPKDVQMDSQQAKLNKVTNTAKDGGEFGKAVKTTTREVAVDASKGLKDSGNALQTTGMVVSAAGAPEVGVPLVAMGSGLEKAGTGIEIAVNVADGDYTQAGFNVAGLIFDDAVSAGLKNVVTKQGIDNPQQAQAILELNVKVVKEVVNMVDQNLRKKKLNGQTSTH